MPGVSSCQSGWSEILCLPTVQSSEIPFRSPLPQCLASLTLQVSEIPSLHRSFPSGSVLCEFHLLPQPLLWFPPSQFSKTTVFWLVSTSLCHSLESFFRQKKKKKKVGFILCVCFPSFRDHSPGLLVQHLHSVAPGAGRSRQKAGVLRSLHRGWKQKLPASASNEDFSVSLGI